MNIRPSTGSDGEILRARLDELLDAPLLTEAEELAAGAAMQDGRRAEYELAVLDDSDGLDLQEAGALFERFAHGEHARQRLILANRRLVVGLVRRHQPDTVPMALVLAAGDDALGRAADRYDPTGGLAFSAFAKWWIEQALREVEHVPAPSEPAVLTAVGRLNQNDCRVIELRLGLGGGPPLSSEETAQVLGIDASQESEWEEVAVAKLRHPCTPGDLTRIRRL